MPNNSKLVMRYEELSFMNVGTTASPDYKVIGEGFTSLSESKNPAEYSRKYINQSSETTDVTGYSPSLAYNVDLYSNNPVIGKIVEVHDLEKVGTDARVEVVSVRMWEPVTEGSYRAFKRVYSIIPDAKGDGTDAMVYSGNFKAVGDFVKGVFTPDETLKAGTFVADTGTVTGVTVTPPTVTMDRGDTETFTAVVAGTGSPSQAVTWSVTGGGAGTSISSGGVLTVDSSESATSLTVIATSVLDNTKTGSATVTVA